MNSAPKPNPCIVSVTPGQKQAHESDSKAMFAGYSDLLTVQDLAEITGLSEQTIRREMRQGNIPCYSIGRRLYCPKQSFIEMISKGVSHGQ